MHKLTENREIAMLYLELKMFKCKNIISGGWVERTFYMRQLLQKTVKLYTKTVLKKLINFQ